MCVNSYKKPHIFDYWSSSSKKWPFSRNHERNFCFLRKLISVSIHIKSHTYLATEEIHHSPEIMKEIFVFQENETKEV